MHEIDIKDWEEFEQQIKELRQQHAGRSLLFRGLGDSKWPLTTTLERHESVEMPFADYYRVISASEPQIQTFVKTTWDKIETYSEMQKMAREYQAFDLHLWGGQFQALAS